MNILSPLVANKYVTAIVMLAIVMWSFGFPTWVPFSDAAALTNVSDTLSDSDSGVSSDHTIVFTNPTAIAEGDTITITFPGQFNVSTSTATLALNDFDVATTSEYTLAADCTGAERMSVATSGQTITLTVCAGDGGAIPANGTTTIEIGTNATAAPGSGNNQIINPIAINSYEITIVTSSGIP